MEKKRLAKVLAAAGVASRRACEELIFDGLVKVNGETCPLPQTMVSIPEDKIVVRGKKIEAEEEKFYFILNKPSGYLCTNDPIKNGHRVVDLFPHVKARLFTVGRLDRDTTGLLLLTNDGAFANRVIHPRYNIDKEYVAKTNREINPEHLEKLRRGTRVEGTFVKPKRVAKVRRNTVKVTVSEGKKREVRLLLERAGLTTLDLKRTRIGNLHLGLLPLGQWRQATLEECQRIFS